MSEELILSGWVRIQGKTQWYGCGTKEELETILENHREEAADHDEPGVRSIEFTPATTKEIQKFRAECGDDWKPNLFQGKDGKYYQERSSNE